MMSGRKIVFVPVAASHKGRNMLASAGDRAVSRGKRSCGRSKSVRRSSGGAWPVDWPLLASSMCSQMRAVGDVRAKLDGYGSFICWTEFLSLQKKARALARVFSIIDWKSGFYAGNSARDFKTRTFTAGTSRSDAAVSRASPFLMMSLKSAMQSKTRFGRSRSVLTISANPSPVVLY